MTPGILNSQEIKSDFNSKMMNFNMRFTSYLTCLESLKKITIWWIALFSFHIQPTPDNVTVSTSM